MPQMPSFFHLAKYVIDQLKPPQDSAVMNAFAPWVDPEEAIPPSARIPLDQIFNLLQLEYGRGKINRHVSERLTVNEATPACTAQHSIISQLSSNKDGIPQIVTTNFDLLFEQALTKQKFSTYVPPAFPDLKHGMSVTGITYLHGRLSPSDEITHDYILSSSDFGRAYLAQGWATNFVRQLLEYHTVVLVGYQAEDPPVKYLLQGLSASQNHSKARLYAFDQGTSEEVSFKWRDRGVTPIPYVASEDHAALWETLSKWSDRAADPSAWRSTVIDLARKSPKQCEPHEKGMVCHLIRSAVGARDFADAVPRPPTEWICVFDKLVRLGAPANDLHDESESIPVSIYGIDDDPDITEPEKDGDDLLSWRSGDNSLNSTIGLSNISEHGTGLPLRLNHLSRWITASLESPTLLWWVIRQGRLHPQLTAALLKHLDNDTGLNYRAKTLWRIALEAKQKKPDDPNNLDWYRLKRMIKHEGWSPQIVRLYEKIMQPTLKLSPPFGFYASFPPKGDHLNHISENQVMRLQLHFPTTHGDTLEIPDHMLPLVYRSCERNLVLASEKAEEAGIFRLPLGSLYLEENRTDHDYVSDERAYLDEFLQLFNRMLSADPVALRSHIELWSKSDTRYFDKLRYYAWNRADLFTASEVCGFFLKLTQEQIDEPVNRRELLFLLRGRWNEFSQLERERVCAKILTNSIFSDDNDDELRIFQKRKAIVNLAWLQSEGCRLPEESKKVWQEAKDQIGDWNENWVRMAATSNSMRSGVIVTDTNTSIFNGVPIDQIVDLALAKRQQRNFGDFTEHEPFLGLVAEKPHIALAALANKARENHFPMLLWSQLLSHWPSTAVSSQTRLLHERIKLLPISVLRDLKHAIADWLCNGFAMLYKYDEPYALRLFDDYLTKISGYSLTAENQPCNGKAAKRTKPQRTYMSAPTGITSAAMEGLLAALKDKDIPPGGSIPCHLAIRILKTLEADDEGTDAAWCLLTRHLPWLRQMDPEWASKYIIPEFSSDHEASEPAWSGLMSSPWQQVRNFFSSIKDNFLQLPQYMDYWNWEDSEKEAYYIWLVLSTVDQTSHGGLSFDEARELVRRIGASGREHVIRTLNSIGSQYESGWNDFVVPFIEAAWPQELKYQNEGTSKAWLALLDDTEDDFQSVFRSVREFLRPIGVMNLALSRFQKMPGEKVPLSEKYPETALDMLDLVIPEHAENVPYGMSQILSLLTEAQPGLQADSRFQRLQEIEQGV